MHIHYFVNHTTRMCQMLSGRGPEHDANVTAALRGGFVEVTADEQDAFRADTQKARDAGWNPSGRTSYAKFIAKSFDGKAPTARTTLGRAAAQTRERE